MCTIHLIELTVAWQNSKAVSCKMHAFLQSAISFTFYTAVLYEPISKLYIYKNSAIYLYDARVMFFCKVQEFRNPTNWDTLTLNLTCPNI